MLHNIVDNLHFFVVWPATETGRISVGGESSCILFVVVHPLSVPVNFLIVHPVESFPNALAIVPEHAKIRTWKRIIKNAYETVVPAAFVQMEHCSMKVAIGNVFVRKIVPVSTTKKSTCPMKFISAMAKDGLCLFFRKSLCWKSCCASSQCRNGGWVCRDQPESARTCSVVGLTHVQTFDGSSLVVKPGNYLLVKVKIFIVLRGRRFTSFSAEEKKALIAH